MTKPGSPFPQRDKHQERIDHATWVMARKHEGRCICLTCWTYGREGRNA